MRDILKNTKMTKKAILTIVCRIYKLDATRTTWYYLHRRKPFLFCVLDSACAGHLSYHLSVKYKAMQGKEDLKCMQILLVGLG